MGIEIERKFLVVGNGWQAAEAVSYRQGYLNRDPARTVRVRLAAERAFLTVKGITVGASRAEFEYEIPYGDGQKLLQLCEGPLIEKLRRCIAQGDLVWEVDEFLGDNAGLVTAEVELDTEHQPFERPPWLGQEVTTDRRYFNSQLAAHPYKSWPT